MALNILDAPSPNFDQRRAPPDMLVLHYTGMKTGHEAVARTARGMLDLVDDADDEPTTDLLTQRLTVHEQTAWMLRSLLEE